MTNTETAQIEGLDVYAANCFQNLFTRERSA